MNKAILLYLVKKLLPLLLYCSFVACPFILDLPSQTTVYTCIHLHHINESVVTGHTFCSVRCSNNVQVVLKIS